LYDLLHERNYFSEPATPASVTEGIDFPL